MIIPQISPFMFDVLQFEEPGWIFLGGQLGVSLGALSAGYISDKTLNTRILQLSASVPLVFIIYVLSILPDMDLQVNEKYFYILVFWMLACFCFGAIIPLANVSYLQNNNIPENYGKVRLFGTMGFFISNLIFIFFPSSPEEFLSYSCIAFIFSCAGLILLPKGRNIQNEGSSDQEKSISLRIILNLLKRPSFSFFLLILLLFYFHFSPSEYIVSTYIQKVEFKVAAANLTLEPIPLAWSLATFSEIIFLYFSPTLLKKMGAFNFLYISFGVGILRFLVLLILPLDNFVVIWQTLHGIQFAPSLVGAILYIKQIVPARQFASAQALILVCGRSAGSGLGAFFLADIAGEKNFSDAFLISTIAGSIGLLLLFFYMLYFKIQFFPRKIDYN